MGWWAGVWVGFRMVGWVWGQGLGQVLGWWAGFEMTGRVWGQSKRSSALGPLGLESFPPVPDQRVGPQEGLASEICESGQERRGDTPVRVGSGGGRSTPGRGLGL